MISLHNPQKYQEIGAVCPKGALLVGPAGNRLRLCWQRQWQARRMCRFFSISGSEFVEMFVGMGASKVRDLFKAGKRESAVHRLYR